MYRLLSPPPAARDASRSHGPANRTGGRPRTRRGPSGLPSYTLISRQQILCASSRSGGEATADLTSTRTMTNPQRKTPRQSPTTGDHVRSDGAHELRRACPRKSAPRSVWRLSSTYPRRPQACICWRKVKDRRPSQCSPHCTIPTRPSIKFRPVQSAPTPPASCMSAGPSPRACRLRDGRLYPPPDPGLLLVRLLNLHGLSLPAQSVRQDWLAHLASVLPRLHLAENSPP